jgi:predicted outer membrane lipoprotein
VQDAALKKIVNAMDLEGLEMNTTQKKTPVLRIPLWYECTKIMKRKKSSDGAGCVYKLKVFWFSAGNQSLVKISN